MNYLVVSAGSLLAAALLWALVLGWWQSNDYQPTTDDLWLHMVALPLALLGGFWLIRGFIDHLRRPVAAPSSDAPIDVEDPLAATASRTAEAERQWQVRMLASAVATAYGDSAEDVLAALSEGPSPQPDPELSDNDGFPVLSVRYPDLPVAEFADRLAEEAPALHQRSDERTLRRLALLMRLVETMAPGIAEQLQDAAPASTLRVTLLRDGPAPAEELAWLQAQCAASAPDGRCRTETQVVTSEGAVLTFLDELILRLNRAPSDDLHLVLAANSWLDSAPVAHLASRGQLFSARNQHGVIAGEAAVGLLVGSPRSTAAGTEPSRLMSRTAHAQRDAPLRATGPSKAQLLENLAAAVLATHRIAPDQVMGVISDTDHRPAHTVELMQAVTAHFPELDASTDCFCAGKATGHAAPFGPLFALALGDTLSEQLDAPVLVISNAHAVERGALLLAPAPAAPTTTS